MGLFNVSMALIGALDTDVLENEKLARHTSYRIGGPASLLVTCHSYHALRRAIETVNAEGVPWVVMGRGSNILVSDDGYRGVVIMLGREFGRTVIAEDGCTLTVGAATVLMRVVNDAYARRLSGLEFAVGIPGTLGGAINMDAGTRDEWIGSVVKSVMTYRPGTDICRYDHDQIAWGYRSCSLPAGEIVLEATLGLTPASKQDISTKMDRYLSRRRRTQPMAAASCGSVFRNPPDGSAGKLIEDCGLKGFCVGGAEVSPVHANFIVNKGAATASDVLNVIRTVRGKVQETYGVELQTEVKFLGF